MAMQEFEKKDFSKLLKHGALEGHRWMKSTDSTCVRVYDRNLQAFPVTIDFYGAYALVTDYSNDGFTDEDKTVTEDLISRFLYVENSRIIWKERKKREGREQHEKGEESLRVSVKENGLLFETELMTYTDTGLFLDQAETRVRVMAISRGMKVLNLFSYTGSFSVYAAAGGADTVVSVDLSNVYTAWAKKNLEQNGFLDESKYPAVQSDAATYLEEAYKRGERYDIVIFDPPAFSNSHKAGDFDVQKDYTVYLSRISRILTAGGVVIFSENLKDFRFAKNFLKPYWKALEITEEVRAQGFSARRSGLRVWMLKKTAEMKEIDYRYAARKRSEMDEEKAERLTLDGLERETEESRPEKREDERREERRDRRPYERRGGFDSRERRGRDRDGYQRRGDSWRDRDDRRDSRDRYERFSDDYRNRDYRDRDRYDSRDRYDRPRYRDDWRDRDDRPRRRDDWRGDSYRDRERRPYGDKESYRQRESWPGRREGGRDRSFSRDRDWDNETGRFYRGERDGRQGRREERYSPSGEDRRPFGDSSRRRRSAPKPYGYDSFMITKNRDAADVGWLKNTEVRGDNSEDDK